MSAFLCDPRHVGALANVACESGHNPKRSYVASLLERRGQPAVLGAEHTGAALVLADQNLRSIEVRYGDLRPGMDANATDLDYRAACVAAARRYVNAESEGGWVQVIAALDRYEYQACEDPDWDRSLAKELCDMIRKYAGQNLPGYHECRWGWPG